MSEPLSADESEPLGELPPPPLSEEREVAGNYWSRPKGLLDWIELCLATGLFSGILVSRSATFGTLLGLPLAVLLYNAVGWWGYLPALALLWVLGVRVCGRGAQILDKKDPREVVFDEIVTLPLVYFLAPGLAWGELDPQILVAGFALHRVFDILKPLGIRRLEGVKGGLGIMIDDVLASLYALAVMQGLLAARVLGS